MRTLDEALEGQYLRAAEHAACRAGISTADEWLLDNFHIVRRTLRTVRSGLVRGFERRLPAGGAPREELPRIHGLAHEILKQSGGTIDRDALTNALMDAPPDLLIAELWALPLFLRLTLLERLRKALERIIPAVDGTAESAPSADQSESVRDREVAEAIRALTAVQRIDWRPLFEKVSHVEQVLASDPADIYSRMDFETRDRYRKEVEELAYRSPLGEVAVARAVIQASKLPMADAPRHVGAVLLGEGRLAFERSIGFRPSWRLRLQRMVLDNPTVLYLGAVGFITATLCLALAGALVSLGAGLWTVALALLMVPIPAATVAVNLVNAWITWRLPPRLLPKMDYDRGIPENRRAAVVVPCLLTDAEGISALANQLEVRYLGNQDAQLAFVLLADFSDATEEHLPGDQALFESASRAIEALNEKYGQGGRAPFLLLVRRRQWNPQQGCWMAWERKRGKLEEFGLLLRGRQTTYEHTIGDASLLERLNYVITLDADTELPRGAAHRLVAAIDHPLNRARFDPSGRVASGYTILQPRVEVTPLATIESRFASTFHADRGLDPYTRAVSDAYQDLFGEGIYVGKGIYDVRAFSRSLRGRVPENALLSHDLFEGIHGRTALVSDVAVYEDYPTTYMAYARRLHRWVRGDWQLLPWLRAFVPGNNRRQVRNRLSLISRWKIADNLRRSLVGPSLVALVLLGWLVFPGSPWAWTLVFLSVLVLPALTGVTDSLLRDTRTQGLRPALVGATSQAPAAAARWALTIAWLPYEAALTLHAIAQTLMRVFVTRTKLLEWTPAAHTAKVLRGSSAFAIWRAMFAAPVLAVLAAAAILTLRPAAIWSALPILSAWAASPTIARWLSRPLRRTRPSPIDADATRRLRLLARRTWLFFETYMGPENQWLAPDHYQEIPLGRVAQRTSPTNIGMGLLATITALDFGYLGPLGAVVTLRNAMDSLLKLERYSGHPLNWYDTATLLPLRPRYVSTVDNGNLAAALIAVREACYEILATPPSLERMWSGADDVVILLREAVSKAASDGVRESEAADIPCLVEQIDALRTEILAAQHVPPEEMEPIRERLAESARALQAAITKSLANWRRPSKEAALEEVVLWIERLVSHLRALEQELELVAPALLEFTEDKNTEGSPISVQPPAHRRLRGSRIPPLARIPGAASRLLAELGTAPDRYDASRTEGDLRRAHDRSTALVAALHHVIDGANYLLGEMDFRKLYDAQRRLFHLGIDVEEEVPDANHYDLLASEARLASLVAIAKGEVPTEHWLQLGRPLGCVEGRAALLSWGGSLFEYLLPPLLAREEGASLLHLSSIAAIDRQIAYGKQHSVPWGVSESCYYAFDADRNYQYRSFGVPGLGFRRGLEDDLVVAPYASLMALPFRPQAVVRNLERLVAAGGAGRFGLYEALDFTESRLRPGRTCEIVRSYMAHHHGMILLSLSSYLLDGPMLRRFHEDPAVRTAELLLHEGAPRRPEFERPQRARRTEVPLGVQRAAGQAWSPSPETVWPEAWVLSNGRLSSVITSRSAGYLVWKDQAITRPNPDPTLEDDGLWIHVRDEDRGTTWTVGRPEFGAAQFTHVTFWPHMARFQHRQEDLAADLKLTIDSEEDVEIRRLWVANRTDEPRRVTVCSHGDVALAPARDDRRHPAFSKLFVESRYLPDLGALLYQRRRRSPGEKAAVLLHMLLVPATLEADVHYNASREAFVGRGGSRRAPTALRSMLASPRSTAETSLDPIMALSASFELAPRGIAEFAWITIVGETEANVLEVAARHRTLGDVDRCEDAACIYSDAQLHRRQIDPATVRHYQRLLSVLLYPHRSLRAQARIPERSGGNMELLWRHGVSGDHPILIVRLLNEGDDRFLTEVLRAHGLWRARGIKVDLIVLDETDTSYSSATQNRLRRALQRSGSESPLGAPGGVFPIQAARLPHVERNVLLGVARAVLDPSSGDLESQVAAPYARTHALPALVTTEAAMVSSSKLPRPQGLLFDNGWGGFTPDGQAYEIYLNEGDVTPAPWSNVIASPRFGTLVTESGGGCTWSENATLNRLTPWRNDMVLDAPSESLYLRDEETGAVWSPTPLPSRGTGAYGVRHEPGRTRFRHRSQGLDQELTLFVAADDPVKVFHLHLRNELDRPRRVTVTLFVEWALGEDPLQTAPFIVPEYRADEEVLLAGNPMNSDHPDRVAFVASTLRLHGVTADRTEFLGRCGRRDRPAALDRVGLAGKVEQCSDPCGALQVHIDLAPTAEVDAHFLLGQSASREAALSLVRRYRAPDAIEHAMVRVRDMWKGLFQALTVRTPDPAMDILVNRWLIYQTVSSRLWGRLGPYQSSGAFGFRDQIQDVLSLVHATPEMVRQHLIEAASHQFSEGDVLHWWQSYGPVGVRTRCSDDLLWLPFAVAHYLDATGDRSVLSETVPFLDGAQLKPEESERYARYEPSDESATLYEHCLRALRRASVFGAHDLPRIGSGDWNDGMNRVGIRGRGESVWLAWFLCTCLRRFAEVCDLVGDGDLARTFRDDAAALAARTDEVAWDGAWYVRAFDDDGDAIGTASAEECRIDALPQAWAVLSAGGSAARTRRSLDSAWEKLVHRDEGIALLLTPPFDRTQKDPGYIKAYPPGVRENGGQYTHAAVWLAWAFAEAGDVDRAGAMFRILCPMYHASTHEEAECYRVEPYVVAADVYGPPTYTGRGGWTWYTGAASWLYRFVVEALLGIRQEADQFEFRPRLPSDWNGYEAVLRHGTTVWNVSVRRCALEEGDIEVRLDGQRRPDATVPRIEDGEEHEVEILVT